MENLSTVKINKKALHYLKCLSCGSGFSSIDSHKITCQKSHPFTIDDGVLILETGIDIPEKYKWGDKLRDPKENRRLDAEGPMSRKGSGERMANSINFIVSHSDKNPPVLLDLASGRGLLMRNLLSEIDNSIIFLSDLDPDVLVGTNKLLQPLQKNNILVPVKASSVHLPFEDNSLPIVTCFGVNNIRDTSKAFEEVYRILQLGGKFVFTIALIEKESPSYEWLQTQEDKPGPFDLIDKWQSEVARIGFSIKIKESLFDGPAEKIPLDLLPRVEGERAQDVGLVLEKI